MDTHRIEKLGEEATTCSHAYKCDALVMYQKNALPDRTW